MATRPWCFYYVQGEEGETADEPNAYQVREVVSQAVLWDCPRGQP